MSSNAWMALIATTVVASGCTSGDRGTNQGECPAGEVCSDATPDGLDFVGPALAGSFLAQLGPSVVATGGRQVVTLKLHDTDDPIGRAFTAKSSGPALTVVDQLATTVTVQGASAGTAYLRIVDPATDELFDRKAVTVAPLARAAIVPAIAEVAEAGLPIVFVQGTSTVGIALYGDVQGTEQRLVDQAMTLDLTNATRGALWDTLTLTQSGVGTIPVTVHAGDHAPLDLTVTLVAGPTSVALSAAAPATLTVGQTGSVCFYGLAAGAQVSGLTWSFTIDGVPAKAAAVFGSCVGVAAVAAGTTTVVATATGPAGAVTGMATLPVTARKSAKPSARPAADTSTSVAGERATPRA